MRDRGNVALGNEKVQYREEHRNLMRPDRGKSVRITGLRRLEGKRHVQAQSSSADSAV